MRSILRKAKKLELNDISKIYMNEFSKPPYNEKWTYKKVNERIQFYYKYYDLYSILLDKKLVGFIAVNPKFMCPGDVAYVEEVAIIEEFQSKGIGKEVTKQIFEIYRKRGFKKFLCIVNKKGNAIKALKKLKVNESKSEILMEKKLK